MAKKQLLEGDVTEWLPNMQYRVECNGKIYLCYVAGRLKLNRIKIVIGDRVRFFFPPNSSIGRIEYRL